MAITPWIGPHRIAIVPVLDRRLDPEPAPDWEYQVRSRVFYDPDPVTGLDRSFQHYLQALSYGRASIEGDVFPMVRSDGPEVNIPAMQALPKGHGYTHLLAILPHDFGNDRGGHAFVDVAAVNGITAWARVAMFSDRALFTRQPLGIWMQELLHMETRLLSHPNLGPYDPMNGAGAVASTHASAHTKSLMGWVSESSILDHADGTLDVRLHAIALLQPPPPDRVTAVRVPSQQSRSSFMIEARVAVDQYERRDGPNDGLPPGPGSAMAKDGVIVYEVAGPETVDLRSGLALAAGEEFVTSDGLRIAVREAIPGGFGVSIKTAFRRLINRSGAFGTPPASGAPTGVVIDALGVHNIVYRDTSGRLHELWRDAAGRTGTTNLTSIAPGAPNAAGNPFSYVDTTAVLELVLYRGSDGHVHSLYWSTGAVGHDQLSASAGAPKAAGNPVGYFTPATNIHHVLYRTGDGHLHALFWSGTGAVGHSDATALAGAPAAAGDPAAFIDTARGDNIVVFRGTDRHIRSLFWSTGPLGHEDLSGFAGTPPAAGDPAAFYDAVHDVHEVIYRGIDGHLYELSWTGTSAVAGRDVTALTVAPRAARDPIAYFSAATNTNHILFVSADQHVHDIAWTPGAALGDPLDVTLFGSGPPAADKPAAFTVDAVQHVVFRGADNQIWEILM